MLAAVNTYNKLRFKNLKFNEVRRAGPGPAGRPGPGCGPAAGDVALNGQMTLVLVAARGRPLRTALLAVL